MSNVVLSVENLYKEYRLGTISHGTLKHDLQSWWARMRGKDDPNSQISTLQSIRTSTGNEHFWALQDASFNIRQGELVGIIGRNGAGKSTLLKIISRITTPTKGTIKIKGRIASLLEVGTGFHPELTGRENTYLNGAILGMSKQEIRRKFDEIVDFAEIQQFIDTPVKRYSSGMYVRLAFAIAAHLEPEILIIDEVLAVGDARFQKRCLGKMDEVGKQGRTILFVSHNMSTISSLCNRGILLKAGMIAFDGPTTDAIQAYNASDGATTKYPAYIDFSAKGREFGDEHAVLLSAAVRDTENNLITEINISKPFKICMNYRILKSQYSAMVPNFHFYTSAETCAFISQQNDSKPLPPGQYTTECHIPGNFLNDGIYAVNLALSTYEPGLVVHFSAKNSIFIDIKDPIEGTATRCGYRGVFPGAVRPELTWSLKEI
jgi:lipopolysaccharide transport system ATP-binding protein